MHINARWQYSCLSLQLVLRCQFGVSQPLLPSVKMAYIIMSQTWKLSWLRTHIFLQGFIIIKCFLCIVLPRPTITVCFLCSTGVKMLSAFYFNSNPSSSVVAGHWNKVARCRVWNSYIKPVTRDTNSHRLCCLSHWHTSLYATLPRVPRRQIYSCRGDASSSSCWASMAPQGKWYNVISRTKQSTGLNREGSTEKQQGPTHLPVAQISSLMGASREITKG